MVTIVVTIKLQNSWYFYVFYKMRPLVSKVSMVTCFLGGVGYIYVVAIFKLQIGLKCKETSL